MSELEYNQVFMDAIFDEKNPLSRFCRHHTINLKLVEEPLDHNCLNKKKFHDLLSKILCLTQAERLKILQQQGRIQP